MRPLWAAADFLRASRRELRYGQFSRAPLHFLRVEWRSGVTRCDWLTREADRWDDNLHPPERERNLLQQTLTDAIALRRALFDFFPDVQLAVLRAFRREAREPPELVLEGCVSRVAPYLEKVSSLVMRAKLYGFQFDLEDGMLRPLRIRGLGNASDVLDGDVQLDRVTR